MIFTLLKTLFVLLPEVWAAIREGRIKAATRAEVHNALTVNHGRRVRAALLARRDTTPTQPSRYNRARPVDPVDGV